MKSVLFLATMFLFTLNVAFAQAKMKILLSIKMLILPSKKRKFSMTNLQSY